jgi:hypothetical protein
MCLLGHVCIQDTGCQFGHFLRPRVHHEARQASDSRHDYASGTRKKTPFLHAEVEKIIQ